MSAQLDMFAPPAPSRFVYVEPTYVETATRAYNRETIRTIEGESLPFEMLVRGIPCVWSNGCTYAINGPGSLFWSETGFRSFGGVWNDPVSAGRAVESYINQSAKSGGCGGKLVKWWPAYVLAWRQSLAFELSFPDRASVWDQWGPEQHKKSWAKHDAGLDAAIERMRADGIDPNEVGKPAHHRGKWPVFS